MRFPAAFLTGSDLLRTIQGPKTLLQRLQFSNVIHNTVVSIRQPSQHSPDQCKFLFKSISTTKTGACWRLSSRDGFMVHRVLNFVFVSFCFSLFCFLRLLLNEFLSAVHGQNQLTSCIFLPWTAQNIAFCWFLKFTLI